MEQSIDLTKWKILAARLHKARKDMEEAKKLFPDSMLADALSVGSSQTRTLKAWSTDKKDKEPLIRTHAYMNSRYPYLATVNDELRKFDKSIIAKKRGPNGQLTSVDLEDARYKGKIRVSVNAPNYWLSKGTPCNESSLESIYYLLSSDIRKVRNHSECNFENISTIKTNMTRTWVQTQEPTINVLGKTSAFYQAATEGETGALGLSSSDKQHVDDILTKIAPKIPDPEDLIRAIRNLSDPKFKYVPVNNIHNIAAIEMRHCLESDTWHISPEDLPQSINEESKILRITCGHLIYVALYSGAFPLETLTDLMRKTFIGNESIEYILREKVPYSEMLISVCQAALGRNIPYFKQLQGVTFVLCKSNREFDNLRDEEREEMVKKVEPIEKTVFYSEMNYQQYSMAWDHKTKVFKVSRGFFEYHIRYVTTSAEMSVLNNKILSMTIRSKNKSDIIHLISCTLVYFNLFEPEKLEPIALKKEQLLTSALVHQLKDHKKWPFTPRTYEPVRIDEFLLKNIPAYKELVLLDSEATSYSTEPIPCRLNPETLEVSAIYGMDGEDYDKVMISARSIRESAFNVVQSNKQLPKMVFSIHPVLIYRMGSDQLLVRLFLEVFNMWLKSYNIQKAIDWRISAVTLESLGPVFEFSRKEAKEMGKMLKLLNDKEDRTEIEDFSRVLLEVLIVNLYEENLSFVNSKIRVKMFSDILNVDHKLFSMNLPKFKGGKIYINDGMDFIVDQEPIFNLKTKQFLINGTYFDYPMLEECKLVLDHDSKKGVPIGALQSIVGEHVSYHGKCYIVKGSDREKTINELFKETEMNQARVAFAMETEAANDSQEDEDMSDFDADD